MAMMRMPNVCELEHYAEVYPVATQGVFTRMFDDFDYELPEWIGITDLELDSMCFTQFGYRKVSLTLHQFIETFPTDWERMFAAAVWGQFHRKWERMLDAANIDYDPIHNFSDVLHEEIEGTEDETTTDDIDKTTIALTTRDLTSSRLTVGQHEKENTGTQTSLRTDNLNEHHENDIDTDYAINQQNNLYGFNSTNVVGDTTHGEQNETHSFEHGDVENTGTQENQRTDDLTETGSSNVSDVVNDGGTVNNNQTSTDDREEVRDFDMTRVRDMTRTGNIGNLSTQNLLEQEFKLWRYNFVQEMIDDVKGYATLPLYV